MELQYIFDYAIRDKVEKKTYGFGYEIVGKESNDRYMSNNGWNNYLCEMRKEHIDQYKLGDGGELDEKSGRGGKNPPKMACYGSSSRIIYTLLKDVMNIVFEKKLATRVGHTANLDAYLSLGEVDIFLEAKSREIYYHPHKTIDVGNVYEPVYSYLEQHNSNFKFVNGGLSKNGDRFKCSYYCDNQLIVHFDIKQLISHFLGIAAGILKGRVKDNIRFVYFIYNPEDLQNVDLDTTYETTINEIERIKERINFVELFKAVFEYQISNLCIDKPMPKFEFVLADQNDVLNYLK